MNKKVDLTVVVTVHNEGLIAHKTMKSVFEALGNVKENGYTYEIIIHIDNGNRETVEYFERYSDREDIKIYKNSFGDLGLSRNFANKKANGKYVTFLDGDDLISPNWYLVALKTLIDVSGDVVVHPEAILTFGNGNNVLTIQLDSGDDDKLALVGDNCWCSVVMAEKKIFEKYPYRRMGGGYGFEDYLFNVNTLADGIRHIIAHETVLFYRRSDGSMLSRGNRDHVVLPYNDYLDFTNYKDIVFKEEKNTKKSLKERSYGLYKKMRNNNTLNYFITPVAKATIKIINYESPAKKNKKVPKYLLNEWVGINHIDSELYPYEQLIKNMQFYSAREHIDAGRVYCEIAKKITKTPDYIFIVPWVMRGGADKVLFNYIEALKEIHPDWHFAVIATLPAKNIWARELPKYVDFVDFGNIAFPLSPDRQETVFSKMLVQLKCKKVHLINSEYGYDWIKKHLNLLRENYDLYISIFAWEFVRGSNMKAVFSYDNPCLFNIYSAVSKIFTDNKAMVRYLEEKNGFDNSKIKVHYQPIRDLKISDTKKKKVDDKKLRVLWAGRIVPEKLPDLVVEISKNVNSEKVSIDVYGEIDKDVKPNIFSGISALKYCGPYDGFNSLPIGKYDVLLYTSLNDGMPNVILEAAAVGLPIIASDDGGVGEFVMNEKTGLLIKDYLNYRPYVEAIDFAIKNQDLMYKFAKNAQNLLVKQHGWDKFVKIVKEDIG